MTKALIALSALLVSASAFANTSVSYVLPTGGNVVLTLPSGFNPEGYSCAAVVAQSAGTLFYSKYNPQTAYVDQVTYAPKGSVVEFTVRTSGVINGKWIHQISTVSATPTRGCSAGGAALLSESAD